jgi:hypothetical protein
MSALLLEGHLPYLGSWDQNFPGILLVHAPQILLLGRSQFAFHLWDILIQLLGCWLLFRLALRWGGRTSAILAPIVAAFYYVQQGLWMAGERDTYVSILMIAAIFVFTNRYDLRRKNLIVGVVLGMAILFRPTYGLLLPAFFVYLILERRSAKEGVRLGLGASLPLAALVLIYLAAGGLDDLYEATILFNTSVYLGQGSVFSFSEPVRFYLPVLPFALIGLWLLGKKDRNTALLAALCLAACVTSIILLYRHSVYHYHPAMTLFLLLASVGLGRSIEYLSQKARSRTGRVSLRIGGVVVILCFFAFQTFRGNTIKSVLADLLSGKITSLEQSYAYYEGSPEFGVHVQQAVGEFLISHTQPGEAVQMFGPYSYPQYYSRTATASRFQTLHALTMRREGDSLTPMQARWRKEYRSDLERVHPSYFIVCDAPEAFRQYYAGRLGHEILREDMTDVSEWLASNYTRDTVIGAFTIYRANGKH